MFNTLQHLLLSSLVVSPIGGRRLSAIPPPRSLNLPTVHSEAGLAGSEGQRLLSLAREGGSESSEAGAVSGGHNVGNKLTVSEAKTKKPAVEPFALAESLPVIPAGLVEKIIKGQ